MSLFQKAQTRPKRLKIYIYGPSGSGKTIASLQFPSPAVIDTERGTDFYADKYDYSVIQTTDIDTVEKAIDELMENPQGIKTLVIDPITVLYEAIQDRHIRRLRKKHNNPYYSLQPKDYKIIKADTTQFILKLLALDMNIVVTARSKVKYSDDENEFMKVIGSEPDGPKQLPYLFDTVLELEVTSNGTRVAHVKKDRTGKLPETFEFSYANLVKHYDIADLDRAPDATVQKEALSEIIGRNFVTTFNGQDIKTAGVTGDQLQVLMNLTSTYDEEELKTLLSTDYKVNSFLDLRSDEADLLISQLSNTEE